MKGGIPEVFWRPGGLGLREQLFRGSLLRLALIVCLLGLALGLWHLARRGPTSPPRWNDLPNPAILQGDVLYRGGLALRTAEAQGGAGVGIDPEETMQSGIGVYERVALTPTKPDTDAMLRLAVIYSSRGYVEEGRELLQRLVEEDEARTDLYMAISAAYDAKPLTGQEVRAAWTVLAQADYWPVRAVLPELYRKAGDRRSAGELGARLATRDIAFGTTTLIVGGLYLFLGLVGLVLLLRALWTFFFLLPVRLSPRGPQATWGPLDALEAAAVVLLASVALGYLVGWVSRTGELPQRAPVADALLFLASYVLVCGCGLLLIRRRLRHSGGSTRDLLGLAGAPTLHRWRQGLTGYCALVAIFAVLAILGQASGVGLPVTAASSGSMSDLLRGQRGPAEVAIYLILTCLLAPLAEETIFRGYVYAGLRRALPMPVAIVASAALFAGTHLSLSAGGMLAVAGVGAMLAYLYERTGSLWPGVVAHLAHNLLALSIILAINA